MRDPIFDADREFTKASYEDLNGDGSVDGTDLAFILAYWGPC